MAVRRNFNSGPFTVQLIITNFETNLAPYLLNFVRQPAVPVPGVFLHYYRPGLLFADFGAQKL
jgi:hypothetical protein